MEFTKASFKQSSSNQPLYHSLVSDFRYVIESESQSDSPAFITVLLKIYPEQKVLNPYFWRYMTCLISIKLKMCGVYGDKIFQLQSMSIISNARKFVGQFFAVKKFAAT